MECAEVLFEFEQEREQRQIEMMMGASVSRVLVSAQEKRTEGSF